MRPEAANSPRRAGPLGRRWFGDAGAGAPRDCQRNHDSELSLGGGPAVTRTSGRTEAAAGRIMTSPQVKDRNRPPAVRVGHRSYSLPASASGSLAGSSLAKARRAGQARGP